MGILGPSFECQLAVGANRVKSLRMRFVIRRKFVAHGVDKHRKGPFIAFGKKLGRFDSILKLLVGLNAHMLSKRPVILRMCFHQVNRQKIVSGGMFFNDRFYFIDLLTKGGSGIAPCEDNEGSSTRSGLRLQSSQRCYLPLSVG